MKKMPLIKKKTEFQITPRRVRGAPVIQVIYILNDPGSVEMKGNGSLRCYLVDLESGDV